jgi:hypothetical protein
MFVAWMDFTEFKRIISMARALRDEHKFRVFGNRVQRRIFGYDMKEITGGWREIHYEELHYLCFSVSNTRSVKSMLMKWARSVALMERREIVTEF